MPAVQGYCRFFGRQADRRLRFAIERLRLGGGTTAGADRYDSHLTPDGTKDKRKGVPGLYFHSRLFDQRAIAMHLPTHNELLRLGARFRETRKP